MDDVAALKYRILALEEQVRKTNKVLKIFFTKSYPSTYRLNPVKDTEQDMQKAIEQYLQVFGE